MLVVRTYPPEKGEGHSSERIFKMKVVAVEQLKVFSALSGACTVVASNAPVYTRHMLVGGSRPQAPVRSGALGESR